MPVDPNWQPTPLNPEDRNNQPGQRWNTDGYRPQTTSGVNDKYGGGNGMGGLSGIPWPSGAPSSGGQPGAAGPAGSTYTQDPYWGNYFQNNFGNVPAAPTLDQTNQAQARAMQNQLIQQLQGQAAGSLNTQAQGELRQGNMNAQAQQYALAAGQRGAGSGAQLQQAQRGAGNIQSGLAGQQQILMRQQQQSAQAALAQMLAAQQAGDVNLANDIANSALRGQGLNDQMNQYYAGQGWQNALNGYQNAADVGQANVGFNLDANNLAQQNLQAGVNAGATALGTLSQIDWGDNESRQQATDPNLLNATLYPYDYNSNP